MIALHRSIGLLAVVLVLQAASVCAAADADVQKLRESLASINKMKRQGDLEGAVRQCRGVVDQLREQLGAGHTHTTFFLNELGMLYQAKGDYNQAEQQLQECLRLRRGASQPDPLYIALSENNLADLYRLKDDYRQAELLSQSSLKRIDQELGAEGLLRSRRNLFLQLKVEALRALGRTFELMGGFEKARAYYEQSLQAVPDEESKAFALARAMTLNNLGWLDQSVGQFASSEGFLKQALEIRERLDPESVDVAETQSNLAMLYHATGDYRRSKELFLKGLALMESRLGANHPRTATLRNNLAGLYRSMGETGEAENLLQSSLKGLLHSEGADHPDVAALRVNLARLNAIQNKWDTAAQEMDQARQSLRQHIGRVLAVQSETEQLTFLKNKDRRWFPAALSLGVAQKDREAIADLSAGWVINGKTVGLQTLAERTVLARDSQDGAARGLLAQLEDVRSQLSALSHAPGQNRQQRQEALDQRERRLSRELGQAINRPADQTAWKGLDDIRRQLPADAVLVEFVRFNPLDFNAKGPEWKPLAAHYAAWVVSPRGAVRVVDLGAAQLIDDAVRALQTEVQDLISAIHQKQVPLKLKDREQRYRDLLSGLARRVVRPLGIDASRRWILSPDASLWLVPWGALPIEKGHFAVEEHPISLVATSRDLLAPTVKAPTSDPVVFAAVDYGNASGETETRGSSQGGLYFSPLRYSASEADQITPLLQNYSRRQPVRLQGKSATKQAFRSLHSPSAIMLSTHGFFMEKNSSGLSENPLLQCGLAFAGANDGDGILSGLEILTVDLRGTDLVVLSACETAKGAVAASGGTALSEGVFSLQYAFQLAGARSVVATLWEVPDEDTAMLTRDFFLQLANGKRDKAEALRRAQIQQITDRRESGESTHPFFWAALTLTGQWK